MIFIATSLTVFTWNSLPYFILNTFGACLFMTYFILQGRPIPKVRLHFLLLVALFAATIFTSAIIQRNEIGGGFLWTFVIGLFMMLHLSPGETKSVFWGLIGTILLMSLYDAFLRFEILIYEPWRHLHVYKFGNIGVDTNYTGFMLVLVYVVILISDADILSRKIKLLLIFLSTVLIIATLSRAAMAVWFMITFYHVTKRHRLLQLISLILVVIGLSLIVIENETLVTKFEIIFDVLDDLASWTFSEFLLGKGGNVIHDGRSLHLLSLQILYFSGLIGVVCCFFIIICIYKLKARYTLWALGLLGLSFVPLSSPVICLALLLESSIAKNKEKGIFDIKTLKVTG